MFKIQPHTWSPKTTRSQHGNRIFAGHEASGCPTFMQDRFEWPLACSQDAGVGRGKVEVEVQQVKGRPEAILRRIETG